MRSHRRRYRRALALLAATGLALVAAPAWAGSLRCDGKLLKPGDPKARLLAACGEPLSRDVVAVVRELEDGEQLRASYGEVWSYQTAGVEGYRLLQFEAGRLVGEGMRCEAGLVRTGDSTVTVLQKCGEPVTRDAAGLQNEPPGPAAPAVVSETLVEQWVYSEGPGSLLRIVALRDGRIESIENGPRR
jgi:hypothetical protein